MNDHALKERIAERSRRLLAVREELKAELFGIDDIIDRAVETLRAWYVLPEIVQRPVIVCLWGLTGTGKTQLVRLLAQKLGFYDRFVEVQMDGFANGSGHWSDSISQMLAESGLTEGGPGILLLDEFQRFRTVGDKGKDIRVERYQDVWALLSDGRLPPALSLLADIETRLAAAEYARDHGTGGVQGGRRFSLTPREAAEVRRDLKRSESLLEVMRWTPAQLHEHLQEFRRQPQCWGTDFSRLLIFVTGNLDEMYREIATRVEDCDTDADIFHAFTRRLSLIDVKKALAERFRPEQIARLGSNHLIYPSLDRAAYERLIADLCARGTRELREASGLVVEVDPLVRSEIYANGVFPAQGTRPLFSAAQALLGGSMLGAALWALELGAAEGDRVQLALAPDRRHFRACWNGRSHDLPVHLELNRLKSRTHPDFRALLAVHEAGHAMVYAMLLKQVPLEVKINVASFDGGYNSFLPLRAKSRNDVLDTICVSLGGRAAEAMVFGPGACTTGAAGDLRSATAAAAHFVRMHGFAGRLSRTGAGVDTDCEVNTALDATNDMIEQVLAAQYNRALVLLQEHAALLARMAHLLARDGEISRERMGELFGLAVTQESAVVAPYAQRLEAFALRHRADAAPAAAPQARQAAEA
jgi:hypothetical protein